jgi:TolA-binding protein
MRLLIAGFIAGSVSTFAQQPANEDLPRRQYESGLSFMQGQRYTEALKDFQAIIDSFPQSQVADNALLQIGLYRLDVAKDLAATQSAIDQLLKVYPDSDSAPMAYVIGGRVSMMRSRAPSDVDAALASFERVERLFPGNDAVPAAGFYAGEALRLVRRNDEALDRFRRVTASYPNSPWAARANLSAGYCLVQADRATAALPEVQRVRQMMPQGTVATDALNINTILYRLYVRAPALSSYTFSGRFIGDERANFDDVMGVTFDSQNRLLLGHKNGISVFDPAKGALVTSIGSQNPSAFFIDQTGKLFTIRDGLLLAEKGESISISVPQPAPKPPKKVEEIAAALAFSSGQRLLIDKKEKTVIKVAANGEYLSAFLTGINTERMAVNRLDDVALIDRDSKGITIVDRDAKPLVKILSKGSNYQIDDPVDVTFDQLGHLYVLDRGKASVLVFTPKGKLITTFTIPEKSPGAFTKARAMGLDPAGRLFIFDEKVKRIQVYQ